MQKAEKAFWAWHGPQYNQADASMAVKHLFSHALAEGGHKRSHMDGHQQSTDLAYLQGWDAERATDSKGAEQRWWSKGFSLSSHSVEPVLPVHHTGRSEKNLPQTSTCNLLQLAVTNQQMHTDRLKPEWGYSSFPCRLSYCAQDFLSAIIVPDILSKSGHHSNAWITWFCTPDTNQSYLFKETDSGKTADGGFLLRLRRCCLTTKMQIAPYNLLICLSLHAVTFSISL